MTDHCKVLGWWRVQGIGVVHRERLVASAAFAASACPVNDDKTETHDHEENPEACKAGSLWRQSRGVSGARPGYRGKEDEGRWSPLYIYIYTYQDFGLWFGGLLVFGHYANVKDSREDEDQTWGRSSTCSILRERKSLNKKENLKKNLR